MVNRVLVVAATVLLIAACAEPQPPVEREMVVIEQVTPPVQSNSIALDVVVSATFNVDMNPGTINSDSITLVQGSDPVDGVVAYDAATRTATLTPSAPLEPSTVYAAAVSADVRSSTGGTLGGLAQPVRFAWSFMTGSGIGPDPAIGGIDVSPPTSGILVGETVQLTAQATGVVGSPDTSVTWSSDDTSVASVSPAGLVTGVGVGTTTITATSNFDASISGTSEVTVEQESTLTGISVSPATATILVGATRQLTATATGVVGSPDTSVTWSSDDTSVASVNSSGVVTGVGAGSATITATSNFDASISGSAEVTVEEVEELSLVYTGSPYSYDVGEVGVLAPLDTIVVSGSIGALSFDWTLLTQGLKNGNWNIDSGTGEITRDGGGGPNNTDLDRNGDRTYRVTVRDGTGATATADVRFVPR